MAIVHVFACAPAVFHVHKQTRMTVGTYNNIVGGLDRHCPDLPNSRI
jgi:hypothetical protein